MDTLNVKYRGVVKTEGQQKKHITQMTMAEINKIVNFFKEHTLKQRPSVSRHLNEKLTARACVIPKELLRDIRQHPKETLVEYNNTNGEPRALFRSKKSVTIKRNGRVISAQLCLVISLRDNKVITAYENETNDGHESCDYRRYNENLRIRL